MFYSQFGEDRILFNIFQKKNNGICIEVGANHGIQDSNSYFFEQQGWKCILVEPNPVLCKDLHKMRSNSLIFECAASNQNDVTTTLHIVDGADRSDGLSTISNKKEEHDRIKKFGFTCRPVQVKVTTLDKILIEANIKNNIDFISIDVEGHEYEALQGFSIKKWNPTIMLIEDNSNCEDNFITNYLKKFHYVRFKRTGVNDWYAHTDNIKLVNRLNVCKVWVVSIRQRIKNRLKKIPLILKIKNFLSIRER